MKIHKLGLRELKNKILEKEISLTEVVDAFYDRIESVDEKIKAYINLPREDVYEKMEERDYTDTELAGLPVALKDNMSTEGIKTTCSSKMLADYVPPFDATVIKNIKEAGGLILGKTNMDEFAMGSSTTNSHFQITHNPWDIDYVAGGSSGGSAAAVAADECPAALGSDTGGSIRQPSSFCGVVGVKPTYGIVSRYGLITYASSTDQIGPITKSVEDAAMLMNVITGYDPLDTTSVQREEVDYTEFLKEDVKDMKIGLPAGYFDLDMNEEVKESVLKAVEKLEKAGAKVEKVDIFDPEYALAAYYIIAPAEASSNLARFDGVKYGYRSEKAKNVKTLITKSRSEGFGDEVKRRIMLGTYALSSGYYDDYYVKALKVRTKIMENYKKLFKEYDLLITPTTPTTAFEIDKEMEPLEAYYADIFTVPVNIAGIPAISLPCGFDSDGLPIGLQIAGPHFGEEKILQTGYTLEKMLDLGNKKPEL